VLYLVLFDTSSWQIKINHIFGWIIQNKQNSVTSIKWLCAVVEIVEMDEELYFPDEVLEEPNAARYQYLKKN
jgi:energy-converting hydrogenase A subunit M